MSMRRMLNFWIVCICHQLFGAFSQSCPLFSCFMAHLGHAASRLSPLASDLLFCMHAAPAASLLGFYICSACIHRDLSPPRWFKRAAGHAPSAPHPRPQHTHTHTHTHRSNLGHFVARPSTLPALAISVSSLILNQLFLVLPLGIPQSLSPPETPSAFLSTCPDCSSQTRITATSTWPPSGCRELPPLLGL